ncbi:MAG: MarR family winged helix-turn-helix transcriptional regulator [Congregibacter sp.]|nr:MarR family winged helix-turn-helix transcriptional regulator [Congregibacter sp.]
MNQLFELGEFLPYRFDRLAKHISVSLAHVYRCRFAVSVPQWRVLALLHQTPQMSAKEIAAQGNLDKVMVSRAVSGLEDRGLLKRQVRRDDARVNELCLTPAGTRLFEAIAPLALHWEHDFLAVLNQQERKALTRILDKLEQHAQADKSSSTLRGSA